MTADALEADRDRADADRPGQNTRLGGDGGGDDDDGENGHPDPVREPAADADLDAAVLMPHTACFDTGNNRQLQDITVDEVIDAIQDAELRDRLRSVCLTDGRCYMTFANAEYLERALHTAFRIRDVSVLLMDTGAGAVILSLTGVPDAVTDKDVLKCLRKYGTIIGGVERKTARGGTTGGERYVRVRPTLGAPRYLWFGSEKVIVRQLTEHETDTMNSIARRKSFRSQIKLNLKMANQSASPSTIAGPSSACSRDESCRGNDGTGTGSGSADGVVAAIGGSGGAVSAGGGTSGGIGTTAATAVSAQNGFRFPTDSKTATGSTPASEPKTASIKLTGSPKRAAKVAQNDREGGPPTADSPLRARRRPSMMGFRRETVRYRGGSVSRVEGGEDAVSDTSTICRRKLSIIGHERAEKVPWCGCWGNGCL